MSRSRANYNKYLMLQKNIMLNHVRKKGLSEVLKVRFLLCKAQQAHTNFLYQMLSFYKMTSFTRVLRTLTPWSVFQSSLINYYISGQLQGPSASYDVEIGLARPEKWLIFLSGQTVFPFDT